MNALVNNGDAAGLAGATGPNLGEKEFGFLREFVLQHCGISLGDHKRQLVQGRLLRRLRALNLSGFEAYCDLLRRDPESELGELASCISTNVTSFFREMHHYDLLIDELLPRWLAEKKGGGRLRIWSAGCSTGEEPYAIAMVLAEAIERTGIQIDAKILATDLSPQALEAARKGVYPVDRLGGVSDARRKRWFLRGEGSFDGYVQVHPRLRELVAIQPLNLLHEWPMHGKFDAIFCRNVVIYFDVETKRALFQRMAALQPPGAILFLGHSENLYRISDQYELIGRTIYRRTGG
jgi:chemotaxis protein methyltransferase CheR